MGNTDLTNDATSQINNYFNQIKSNVEMQSVSLAELSNKNTQLMEKQKIQIDQLKEIEDKEKLLLTRSRMLQISQDRNSYKKKIIYSLIAVIFAVFILTIVMYVLFSRKINMIK